MLPRHVNQDDAHAVRILDPHLDQAARLASGRLQDPDPERSEPLVFLATWWTCSHNDPLDGTLPFTTSKTSKKPPVRENTTA